MGTLHGYNPIYHSGYELLQSCVARPTFAQDITFINMAIHGRGCGHTSVELCVVASANV